MGELPWIPALSHSVKLKLLNLLTSQLDRELTSYNTIMDGLKQRVDKVLQKGRKLLDASSSLRKKKVELEGKHLN